MRPVRRSRGAVDVAASPPAINGDAQIGFRVDRAVIPVGVRCEACGRSHLPAKVIADRGAGDGRRGARVVRLRCPRCAAASEIALDGGPEKADLLDVLGVDGRAVGSSDSSTGGTGMDR